MKRRLAMVALALLYPLRWWASRETYDSDDDDDMAHPYG